MTTPAPPPGPPPRYGPPISLALAKVVMAAAEREAAANGWPMVIAIVDSTSHLVLLARLDHTQFGSVPIAIAKAQTAVDFRRPTSVFQDALAAGGAGLRMLGMPGVTPLEGGLPLFLDGQIVGAIGVSGMQSGQDAKVARAGLAAMDA